MLYALLFFSLAYFLSVIGYVTFQREDEVVDQTKALRLLGQFRHAPLKGVDQSVVLKERPGCEHHGFFASMIVGQSGMLVESLCVLYTWRS